MANVELRLKVSKNAYREKIDRLQNYLNRADNTISSYENKKTMLDSFMDGTDDNYEATLQMIEDNIARVRKARSMCEASIQMLQGTLNDIDDFGENLKKNIETFTDLAKNTADAAFDAANLLS